MAIDGVADQGRNGHALADIHELPACPVDFKREVSRLDGDLHLRRGGDEVVVDDVPCSVKSRPVAVRDVARRLKGTGLHIFAYYVDAGAPEAEPLCRFDGRLLCGGRGATRCEAVSLSNSQAERTMRNSKPMTCAPLRALEGCGCRCHGSYRTESQPICLNTRVQESGRCIRGSLDLLGVSGLRKRESWTRATPNALSESSLATSKSPLT